ncbi:MAG: hypothetical protein IKQ76_00550 [Bacteroidales bacterium]|nr:hypothetical protein [Bacteroidales bacterium]
MVLSIDAHGQDESRFTRIARDLDSLAMRDARYLEPIDVSVTNFAVADLLKTLAIGNKLNINLALERHGGQITCNLEQVPVKDVLLLCCRRGDLNLTVENGIVSFVPYLAPEALPEISISRNEEGLYDMDFSGCRLDVLVRRLISETGKNILYAPSLAEKVISAYGVNLPLEGMLENIALSNDLRCEQKDESTWILGERGRDGRSPFSPDGDYDEYQNFCVRVLPMQYRTIDDVVEVIPTQLAKEVEIKLFPDLNSLVLSGNTRDVEELQGFLKGIDKEIPLISIDVLIVEETDRKSRSTGLTVGKGREASKESYGTVGPGVDISLGSKKINEIIHAFNGLGLMNLGDVGPNFYANLKLLEDDGLVTLRSTPKLATLNGHKAVLKSGEVKYYKEGQVNIIGTQNPMQSESYIWKNVEASFILDLTPTVSADSTITIRINLSQDEFTERDSGDLTAPPGMTKRGFNSIVKVKDGDMVLLGGIEKNLMDDSSQGVPWISRVPILRLFFAHVTKTKEIQKLNVFIRPTIVQ